MSERKSIDAWLDTVAWEAIPPSGRHSYEDGPYATHQGTLMLPRVPGGDPFALRVYQLNDGQRVFDADDFAEYWSADE